MNRNLKGRRWIFIILAVTGFMRVAIIAVPVVGLYMFNNGAVDIELGREGTRYLPLGI